MKNKKTKDKKTQDKNLQKNGGKTRSKAKNQAENKTKFFSIGEIAKAIGLTRRIILNYETKGVIVPDKKDGSTGNRYYTIDTFTQIRTVRVLQNLGLSLDEIKEYFNDASDLRPLIKRLETLRDEINLNIEKLYERTSTNKNEIKIIKIEAQTVYRKTYRTQSIAERSVVLRETALEAMRKYVTDTTRRMYFTEYPLNDTDEITYAVAVLPESSGENVAKIPNFSAVSVFHYGAYEDICKTREKLISYANENNLKISGICRHIYVEGPPQHKDPAKFITQILLPIDE